LAALLVAPLPADSYYEQALELRRAEGDRGGAAATLYNLSFVIDPAEAIGLVEQAYSLWRDIQSPNANIAAQRLAELR
jgi:hypothetical protein